MSPRKLTLIIVGSAAVLALAGLLTAVLIALTGNVTYSNGGIEVCSRPRDASQCEVGNEAVEKLARMDLPDGTVIESSGYQQFQDWHLEATFVVPADGVAQWEASLGQYPSPDAASCAGLPELGPGQVCASTDPTVGVIYRYARSDMSDGSVKVAVDVIAL